MPSFNKENFTNFHQGTSQHNRHIKTAVFHCASDQANCHSQLIVNEKFNIVVKYLKKKPVNTTTSPLTLANTTGKRSSPEDVDTLLKRRRIME